MKTIVSDLKVCTDCLEAIEFSDEDLGYTPGTIFKQQQRMLAVWPEASSARFVSDGSQMDDFSTSKCEGCGTYMAGARYGYALIGD